MRVFDGVLVKTTPATMAVIEELNEMTDFIQYRISDEYVLCKPNSTTTLEKQIRVIHEKHEKVTRDAVNACSKERA